MGAVITEEVANNALKNCKKNLDRERKYYEEYKEKHKKGNLLKDNVNEKAKNITEIEKNTEISMDDQNPGY